MSEQSALPLLAEYSTVPRYNIQAVERATGLSPRTLRSWERRYDVPRPARGEAGRRLYSDRDIALIRWLLKRTEEGMSIGRAVAMLSEESADTEAAVPPDLDHLQLRLLQAIDWLDEDETARILATALAGASVEDVVLRLITPVLYRVGDLWASGRMSVASEHFGTHLLRSELSDLLRQSPQPSRPYHILVGSAPHELHDVGALVLALFLRRGGFRVTYLGANVEGESLAADMRRIRPHAVCLSATTDSAADALATLYTGIAATFGGILAYGGPVFAGRTSSVPLPGLDLGTDVREAVDRLTVALEGDAPSV